jgi:hypothetical protein
MQLAAMLKEITTSIDIRSFLMDKRLIVLCLALVSATPASPPPAEAHDGRLDQFGCHHDQNQKYYHCHEGPYTRLSFDSKNQMIERLRNQYIALGRTWPYADAINTLDQPATIVETTLEPQAVSFAEIKQAPPGNRWQATESGQRISRKEMVKPTNRQPSQAQPKTEITSAKRTTPSQSEARRKRTEPELKVWVTQIRADGRPIFESKEGERFFLDERGTKVLIERGES